MAERIVPVPGRDGKIVNGVEVPVQNSQEQWSEYKLADGSVIRIKQALIEVIRLPRGNWDPEGNPLYAIKVAPVMIVVSAPDDLKQPK